MSCAICVPLHGGGLLHNDWTHLLSQPTKEAVKRKGKRLDDAGFEPTTFPMKPIAKGTRYHCAKRPISSPVKESCPISTIQDTLIASRPH